MGVKRRMDVDSSQVERTIQEHEFTQIALRFELGRPCVDEIRNAHVHGGVTHGNVLPGAVEIMQYGRTI